MFLTFLETSSSRNNYASSLVVAEEEEDVVVVVVEVLSMVLLRFWDVFLVKFTDEKDLVTDRPTDQRTDKPSYRDAWMHLKIRI